MENEKKNILRDILNTPARQLKANDKKLVESIAQGLGLVFEGKRSCGSCWHDLAIKCMQVIEEREVVEGNPERRYILKPGVDLIFGRTRVNAQTLTDEMAERILSLGFERKHFAKIPEA